jgi:hypothetical protein
MGILQKIDNGELRLQSECPGVVVSSRPVPRWRLTALRFDYRLFRSWENSPWWAFWKALRLHFLRRKTLIYPPWKQAQLRAEREVAEKIWRRG